MTSYGITDRGLVRQVNEDDFYISDGPVGSLPNLYVVADGMGGHNAGEVASKDCIRFFVEYMSEAAYDGDAEQLFHEAFAYANERVFDEGYEKPELRGMGTTMVAMSVFGDRILVGNVGDSRLYVVSSDLKQVTVDHSVVEELFRAGAITEVEKYHHPDRNMITRAMGVDVTVNMDFFQLYKGECSMVLMCSDGLTKMLTDEEIRNVIGNASSVQEKAEKLLAASVRNGGQDNITIILVDLQKEAQQ